MTFVVTPEVTSRPAAVTNMKKTQKVNNSSVTSIVIKPLLQLSHNKCCFQMIEFTMGKIFEKNFPEKIFLLSINDNSGNSLLSKQPECRYPAVTGNKFLFRCYCDGIEKTVFRDRSFKWGNIKKSAQDKAVINVNI